MPDPRYDSDPTALPSADRERRPALRPVDVFPIEQDGRRGLVLSDPLGVATEQAFLPDAVVDVVARFDGSRTIAEIEAELSSSVGAALPPDLVPELVRALDARLLLHGDAFESAFSDAVHAFLTHDVRPAAHAGSSGYPADADALRSALQTVVDASAAATSTGRETAAGLVAPHIDLTRGADGYRAAYGWLAEHEPADLYVVFGTGHQGPSAPLTGLSLDWETPLGRVRTNREFVARVHERIGGPEARDVFLHRREHSLEFQVLWLTHVLAGHGRATDSFEVACFLTGSLPSGDGDPSDEDYARGLVDALQDAAERSGQRVCWIAGADLAHLGPAFGDALPVDDDLLARLHRDETTRLEALTAARPGAFHAAVVADGNPDRVCGASPIWFVGELAGGPGDVLHYGQAVADDRTQVVSFCSIGFRGPPTN